MSNSPFQKLARKDFLTALQIWIALEILCFVAIPSIGLIRPAERLPLWFLASLPMGIGGALLVGGSSQFIVTATNRHAGLGKVVFLWLSQTAGWLGMAGVLFPLFMFCTEFLTEVVKKVKDIPS